MRKSLRLLSMLFPMLAMGGTHQTPLLQEGKTMPDSTEIAIFGGGCFWCVEAVFETMEGVLDVQSGYSGGWKENPGYREVCTGRTGHAEVVKITFDPSKVSYERLVRIFFESHDPTTLNRQGADEGTQYRSVIFTSSPQQREIARRVKGELDASGKYKSPIVTEIASALQFYLAEAYHQDYYRSNPTAPYSRHIRQKLEKLGPRVAKPDESGIK